jgi:hypothetical protein
MLAVKRASAAPARQLYLTAGLLPSPLWGGSARLARRDGCDFHYSRFHFHPHPLPTRGRGAYALCLLRRTGARC